MIRIILYFVIALFLFRLVKNLFLPGKQNSSKDKHIHETSNPEDSAIDYNDVEDANYEDIDK